MKNDMKQQSGHLKSLPDTRVQYWEYHPQVVLVRIPKEPDLSSAARCASFDQRDEKKNTFTQEASYQKSPLVAFFSRCLFWYSWQLPSMLQAD